MQLLLLTVGNIYIDQNVFGVNDGKAKLEWGKDYFATASDRVLGGSAVNAALQARRLGIEVGFIGKTGTDAGSDEVKALLNAQGILYDLMREDAKQKTSMAVNLIDRKGEFIGVHYGEASRTLQASDIAINHTLFKRCNAIYFGGTAKQPLLFKDCEALFCELKNRGIKVFYDPNRFPPHEAPMDRALLQTQLVYVEGYFPNEGELLQVTNTSNVDDALDQILHNGPVFVALKQGAKGCRIKTLDDDFIVEGKRVEVISTVGAGDCFNATFIAYYLKGASLRECAERATAAAAIKVSKNVWPDEAAIENMLGKNG